MVNTLVVIALHSAWSSVVHLSFLVEGKFCYLCGLEIRFSNVSSHDLLSFMFVVVSLKPWFPLDDDDGSVVDGVGGRVTVDDGSGWCYGGMEMMSRMMYRGGGRGVVYGVKGMTMMSGGRVWGRWGDEAAEEPLWPAFGWPERVAAPDSGDGRRNPNERREMFITPDSNSGFLRLALPLTKLMRKGEKFVWRRSSEKRIFSDAFYDGVLAVVLMQAWWKVNFLWPTTAKALEVLTILLMIGILASQLSFALRFGDIPLWRNGFWASLRVEPNLISQIKAAQKDDGEIWAIIQNIDQQDQSVNVFLRYGDDEVTNEKVAVAREKLKEAKTVRELRRRHRRALDSSFIGSCEILDRVGEVSYRLAVTPQAIHLVHNVFQRIITRGQSYEERRAILSKSFGGIFPSGSYLETEEVLRDFFILIFFHDLKGNGDGDEFSLGDSVEISFPESSSTKKKKKKKWNNSNTGISQTFPQQNHVPSIAECMDIVATFPGFEPSSTDYNKALRIFWKNLVVMMDSDSDDDNNDYNEEDWMADENTWLLLCGLVVKGIIIGHNALNKKRLACRTSSRTGNILIQEILNGHPRRCYEDFRLHLDVFKDLCSDLKEHYGLQATRNVSIEESLGIFLMILAHGCGNRLAQETFNHSGETIHRHFHKVLKAVLKLSGDIIRPNTTKKYHLKF
ncbi:hypothetical protein Tco_0801053 [Tanacetum coccineum]|uniref:DUF8040 domain-containing protein n=1 Tax=Tanacetum coccineum TaxID=301880 RepID=A0ABQ4ZVU3_9ASTR